MKWIFFVCSSRSSFCLIQVHEGACQVRARGPRGPEVQGGPVPDLQADSAAVQPEEALHQHPQAGQRGGSEAVLQPLPQAEPVQGEPQLAPVPAVPEACQGHAQTHLQDPQGEPGRVHEAWEAAAGIRCRLWQEERTAGQATSTQAYESCFCETISTKAYERCF